MATIRDVARQAGVSHMTVSRVVNKHNGVAAQTRERVEQVILEMGYVPNTLARDLARRRSGVLAVAIPDIANPFFTLIVRGAEDVARRNGYRVFLCNTLNDLDAEAEYLADMVAHQVAGILIAPVNDRSVARLRMLERQDVPFVLVDRSIPGLECDLVQGDSLTAARQLVDHLICEHGHQRIGVIIREDDKSTDRDRLRGYWMALQAAKIAAHPALIVESGDDIAAGRQGMKQLLEIDPLPTAVITANNLLAAGAAQVLCEEGLSVPKDMALVCFEDVGPGSLLMPFLTSMAQPAETLGTISMQLLLDRIEGRAPMSRRTIVLPAHLVLRESCGGRH